MSIPERKSEQRYRETQRVNWLGTFADVLLTVVKLVFGIAGRSQSLIADGFHSLADVVTDLLVLFAAHHGREGPDADHPYGHARIETAASVGMGLVLLLIAVGLMWDAIERLFEPSQLLIPDQTPLFIAGFALLVKEFLYRYTLALARRHRSPLLRANAWHHRSDAVSSLVVLVGVAGTRAGLHYLDAIGAVMVGMMIVHVAWELSWNAVRELIDTGLSKEQLAAIERIILAVHGVKTLHMLRTRHMGADALVDVHILLRNPEISVSEGHQVSETVRAKLIREVEEVADVTVHIDPEDDERQSSCTHLPLRDQILIQIEEAWRDVEAARHLREVVLHYLDGQVHLDVVLPLALLGTNGDILQPAHQIETSLRQAVMSNPNLGRIRIRFEEGAAHH
ncbi:ferrous-iron efflux pump FieF [Gammaproteobacteria bacterium]